MAIGSVIKMWSRSSGSMESEDLLKRRVSRRQGYTIDHSPNEKMSSILSAADLPSIGDQFEDMPWVLCKRLIPNQISPILTVVEAEYEGEVATQDDSGTGSPIDDAPEIYFENVVSTEPTDTYLDPDDGKEKPIATVNKEPIDGVTKPISDIMMTVKRNFISVNLPATQQYLDSVNSDAYPPGQPFPPGTGHLERFRATQQIFTGANTFWEVEAQILFRQIPPPHTGVEPARAWWARVRHEGWRHKVDKGGANERIVNAFDNNQQGITRPVLLDEDGVIVTDPADVHWLEFQIFNYKLPYSALGLV